jgi:hypothetical protein
MSDKLITRAIEEEIATARALGNRYDPDLYGRFPWVTRDYGNPQGKALTISKARLGLFFEALLRHGGDITSIHAMGRAPRNYVQALVTLTLQGREAVEQESGITLEPPPVVRVNSK